MNGSEVIKTENLYKKFRIGSSDRYTIFTSVRYKLSGESPKKDLWALKNINISVNKGEMIAVIGPNGAGKTTLLKILAGIIKHTSGKFEVREKVSSIFELEIGFIPRFNAIQNAYLYGAIHGISRNRVKEMLPEIIDYSELGDFTGAKLRDFSSGMRQRLAFATVIQTVEGIILVDEVLTVGDESFRNKCIKSFARLLNEGKTIIFVSHGIDETVKRMCSRALYINKGEQRYFGFVEKAMSLYKKDIGNL